MHGQHSLEKSWLRNQRAERTFAQSSTIVHQQHQCRHSSRHTHGLGVRSLIIRQIAGAQSFGQRDRLLKRDGQPLAGNCIDRTCGFAYQREFPQCTFSGFASR